MTPPETPSHPHTSSLCRTSTVTKRERLQSTQPLIFPENVEKPSSPLLFFSSHLEPNRQLDRVMSFRSLEIKPCARCIKLAPPSGEKWVPGELVLIFSSLQTTDGEHPGQVASVEYFSEVKFYSKTYENKTQ
ncbi:hypothetical protein AMECASPLE_002521 [Ameca splendens]|uniref:Uncharacterized protein n=1 Tax=Ameca splendens TaxID=208324 RepID=A0ABV0Y9H7_9TELE